jgi:AcrR family transcriptional regulator
LSKTKKSTDTAHRILEISEKLFAERGFDATGIEAIAREVGISKSVIYYYFKNKKEILAILIQNSCQEILQILAREDPTELLKTPETYLTKIYNYWLSRISIAKIITAESLKRQTGDIPLIAYWDELFHLNPNYTEGRNHPVESVMFFLSFLPTITYAIFLNDWCKHYELNQDEYQILIRQQLTEASTQYLLSVIEKNS